MILRKSLRKFNQKLLFVCPRYSCAYAGKGLKAWLQDRKLIRVSILQLIEFGNLKSQLNQTLASWLGIQVVLTEQSVAIDLWNEKFRFG
jgi:hypothetical protein